MTRGVTTFHLMRLPATPVRLCRERLAETEQTHCGITRRPRYPRLFQNASSSHFRSLRRVSIQLFSCQLALLRSRTIGSSALCFLSKTIQFRYLRLFVRTENFKQGSEYDEHALASQRPGLHEVSVHHACTSSMVHEVPTPTPSVSSPYFFSTLSTQQYRLKSTSPQIRLFPSA
jgi:hypothetical protein